ncbi:chemokine-like receptor 1 [Protopterus annectens]|uniref:chemokine-like receptor 1 n=1 Tax=Protopterus annectens TaxID=7888 RepID=UPI001CFC3783|nr:chemokine-like receptor 1 [Protopterus annectens]
MEHNITAAIPVTKNNAELDVDKIMDMVQVALYGIIFILGTVGNGIVIWITGFQMQKTVNSIWFLNLAVADFIFSLARIIPLIKNAFYTYWPFGQFLCKVNSFIKYLNMFCSVFLLAVISFDRCASVVFPVWSKNQRTIRFASISSIVVWVLSVIMSSPFYVFRNIVMNSSNKSKCTLSLSLSASVDRDDKERNKQTVYFIRFFCGFLIPFIVIATCYAIIAIKVRSRRFISSNKTYKIIFAIIVTFFLCWMPYHVFLLLKYYNYKGMFMDIGSPLTSCIAYLNSCMNPILYFFMGIDFQNRLRHSAFSVLRKTFQEEETQLNTSSRQKNSTAYEADFMSYEQKL